MDRAERDDTKKLTRVVIVSLVRECREWAGGRVEFEIQDVVYVHAQTRDPIIFTDGSVVRGKKSGVSWFVGGAGW